MPSSDMNVRWVPMSGPATVGVVWSLLAISAVAYWPSLAALGSYWDDSGGGGQYGYLVALLSFWLLLRGRGRLKGLTLQPTPLACVPLLLCSILAVVSWRAGIQSLEVLMLPVCAWLAVMAAAGPRIALAAGFPVAFLLFAIPGWGLLGPILRELTVAATRVLSPLVALPVHVVGNDVALPSGARFEIGPYCSGVNFLVAGLAVAALIGELDHAPARRRVRLLVCAGLIAIVGNWIRVLTIIALGYATDMRLVLATRDHLLFGWMIFAVVLLAYVWWAGRGASRSEVATEENHDLGRVATDVSRRPLLLGCLASLAALIAAPISAYAVTFARNTQGPVAQLHAPSGQAGWRGPSAFVDPHWRPTFVGSHSEGYFTYEDTNGRTVEVVAIGYPRQEQGAELVNEGNSLIGTAGREPLSYDIIRAGERTYREAIVEEDHGRRSVIWSVYDIGGRLFVNPFLSQLWYGLRALGGAPYSALFAFRAACRPTCREARATLTEFQRDMASGFFEALPSSRKGRS